MQAMIIYLGCRSPDISCNLPGSIGRAALKHFSIWFCIRWGLPCPDCHQPGGELLPRHFNLTCSRHSGSSAVYFLWHFPSVSRSSRYEPPRPAMFGLSSPAKKPKRPCVHPVSRMNIKKLQSQRIVRPYAKKKLPRVWPVFLCLQFCNFLFNSSPALLPEKIRCAGMLGNDGCALLCEFH